ncbi:MAG: nodulation protein NfeD [Halanaerobiales bacterium]|nr:nodulation protein NfeD [Halanaerobiales bacterium]
MKNKIILLVLLILIFTIHANAANIVYQIPIEGDIDQAMFSFINSSFKQAVQADADLIIFRLDTYGGYIDPAIKIKDLILNSQIKTVTYVPNRAWSAGALIALAGGQLVMKNGSSIGAAETRPNEEKYISALRKEFKSTAEARGRNPEIAEAMVDVDLEIKGVIKKGKLLTLTSDEAIENNFIDKVIAQDSNLYNYLGVKISQVTFIEEQTIDKFVGFITNPYVSSFLLIIGFTALIFEILVPGFGVGGTVGLISFGLFFSGYLINGIASWGIIVLFLIGLLLIILEVFVVPGFGITGIGGIISVLISLYFLFPSPQIAINIIASTMIATLILTYFIIKYFGSSKLWSRISLRTSQKTDIGYVASVGDKEIINKRGKAITPLRPAGIVEIDNRRIDVVSEGEFIDKGEKVTVIDVKGSKVIVKLFHEEE